MEQQTNTPEQEMREIFAETLRSIANMRDKVITTVVSHSQLARNFDKLQQDFNDLQKRMNTVVDEAQRYRTDLHAVIAERDMYKRDADDHLALAHTYQKDVEDTRNRLNEAQGVSTRLGEELAQEKQAHQDTKAQVERLNRSAIGLGQDRDYYRERYNESRDRADKAEQALKEANDKLAKLQGTFRELFPSSPIVEQTKPVELPGNAPRFQVDTPHQEPGQNYPAGEPGFVVQQDPHPVQAAGVNERIDGVSPQPDPVRLENEDHQEEVPWWKKAEQAKL